MSGFVNDTMPISANLFYYDELVHVIKWQNNFMLGVV